MRGRRVALLVAAALTAAVALQPGAADARTVQPLSAVSRAWKWIAGQRGTGTDLASSSTILAARTYPSDWTGPVSGTFEAKGVSTPPVVDGAYQGWVVRAYVVTDTAYLIDEEPASADGTWSFPDSRPGTKVFQLVDTGDDAVLAEQAPDFGLVRSYADGTRCWSYDQALAVLAALSVGADASALTAGLLALQRPDGGFVDSVDVRNPAVGVEIERTGVAAVATYALLERLAAFAPGDPSTAAVQAGAEAGVAFLLAQQRPDGLLGAGNGVVNPDGTVDPGARPAWVSTEHNLDSWWALRAASAVLGDAAAAQAADSIQSAVVGILWDGADGRFVQGLDETGAIDPTDPLDVNSWGALFLRADGLTAAADAALAHTAAFASTVSGHNGFRPYRPQPAFPDPVANVWTEGTAGVALATARAGDPTGAARVLAQLSGMQQSNGGFPSALVTDTDTDMTDELGVAGTAWFLLASTGGIWTP